MLECDLRYDLLEFAVLGAKVLDLIARRFANGVARELLLARFEEVLAPAVVQVRGDPLATAQL